MEHHAAATVPVKLTLSGSKRRSRLNVPLQFSQLCKQVRTTFPDVKDFKLQYVDEEDETILVTCDADLEEARNVFQDLDRVLSFTVNTTPTPTKAKATPTKAKAPSPPPASTSPQPTFAPKSGTNHRGRHQWGRPNHCGRHQWGRRHMAKTFEFPISPCHLGKMWSLFQSGQVPALHFGITCDGSNEHPIMGKRYHKIGCNYDLNETEFAKLTPSEQQKYELITHPGAVPVPIATMKASQPVLHFGVTCDGSNQHPLVGVRYHKIGHNYDLNEAEFSKLSPSEQRKYEIISRPGATPVPVAKAPVAAKPECTFVRDVTIPDGQVVPAGAKFKKTWLVKTGVNGWPGGCTLAHISGDKMGATRIAFGPYPQKPNTLVPISVDFTAPSHPGKLTSKWQVAGPNGKRFGHHLWSTVVIKPQASSAVSSAKVPASTTASASVVTPVPTPVPSPPSRQNCYDTVSVSTTSSASSASSVTPAPPAPPCRQYRYNTSLQQLLQMGFPAPIETLKGVLNSTHGDLNAAITKLVSNETY